jgi:hypothetical protein
MSKLRNVGEKETRSFKVTSFLFAFGSNFILSWNQLDIAAQTAIQPMISPPSAGAGC